eukprot:8101153-Karenia_brevis.AAC.1
MREILDQETESHPQHHHDQERESLVVNHQVPHHHKRVTIKCKPRRKWPSNEEVERIVKWMEFV